MPFTPSDAALRVHENVGRVPGDQRCPTDVILRRLDSEYRLLRRRLATEFPTIYERVRTVSVGVGNGGSLVASVALTGAMFRDLEDKYGAGIVGSFHVDVTLDDESVVKNVVSFMNSGQPSGSYIDQDGVGIVIVRVESLNTRSLDVSLSATIPAGRGITLATADVNAAGTLFAGDLTAATMSLRRAGGKAGELGTMSLLTEGTMRSAPGLEWYGDPSFSGATWISKPDDFESIRLLERKSAFGEWTPLTVVPTLNRNECVALSFFESGSRLSIVPEHEAPGEYRLTYSTRPADDYDVYDLPPGLENILIEEVSAFVRQRHEEDPSYHKTMAAKIWSEQYMSLWSRYGAHGMPGLGRTRL